FNELKQFKEAIHYQNKAIALKKTLKGDHKRSIDNSINNLGHTYKDSGQYDLAIKAFSEVLKNKNLINERPYIYVLALDNYAHTLYLSNDYSQLPKLYHKALKICDSINASYKSIIIHQHLA
uniref:tetratricopeptide repeat protein n=1 Tax=uncultured Algibacter sp. TaxID=298659 RepID=UPI003216409E